VSTPAGQIEPQFPTLSAEKEFAQATGRAETAGLSDRRALHAVLSQRENRSCLLAPRKSVELIARTTFVFSVS
jgi:hypothetical protein